MIRRTTAAIAALTMLLAGCGGSDKGGPPPSQAGDLVVTYFQGGGDPGAMLLSITGGTVQNVTAASGQQIQVAFSAASAGTTRVIVTGNFHTGDLLVLRVPDVTVSTGYSARIEQVADKVTFSLVDVSSHTLTIHR